MFGQAIGAAVGSGIGMIGGALQGVAQQSSAKNLRKRIREGVDVGMADTARQVGTVMSSPEYLAANKLLRGIYGMDTSAAAMKSDLYDSLIGMYGYNNTFGYGTKNYGRGNDIKMNGNALAADSHAAWNEQYLNERFGLGNLEGNQAAMVRNVGSRLIMSGSPVNARTSMAAAWNDDPNELSRSFRKMQKNIQYKINAGVKTNTMEQRSSPSLARYSDTEMANMQSAAEFYGQAADTFSPAGAGGALDTLAADFQKGLAAAQMGRGLYNSQAGAAAEAGALAAFRANKQLEMLPQMLALAQMPLSMTQQYSGQNMQMNVFQRTGGKAVYGQETAGAYGGSIMGSIGAGMIQGAGQGAAIGGDADYLSYLRERDLKKA